MVWEDGVQAGKKEGETRHTRRKVVVGRTCTATATTIQFGALHRRHVTISRLRATCYMGDAMLGNCLRLRRRTQPPTRVGSWYRLHTCPKQKDGVGGLVGDARIGEVKEKDGGVSQSVADRRVLGRSIFCIWICRICQISQTMSLLPSFLFQTASNARG